MDATLEWDEISGFRSLDEFNRFLVFLDGCLIDQTLREVAVISRYSNIEMFDERWFGTSASTVWRLVAPEIPFRGVFLRIPRIELRDGRWYPDGQVAEARERFGQPE